MNNEAELFHKQPKRRGGTGRARITDPAATIPGQRILRKLERYPALTLRQLNDVLGYSQQSKLLEKHVRRLAQAGLVGVENTLPWTSERVVTRDRKRYQAHYLLEQAAIADTLIAFECFADVPEVELLAFLHERQLRRHPVRVSLPTGQGTVVPDGYVAYELPARPLDERKHGFAIEVDGGTEKLDDPYQARDWQGKIERLVAMGEGNYRDIFPADALTVAVVVRLRAGDPVKRRNQLIGWTEQLLTEQGRTDWLDYFRFTSANPTAMSAEAFVAGSHWVRILGNGMYERVPLVAL